MKKFNMALIGVGSIVPERVQIVLLGIVSYTIPCTV
jgi:hypothetical protein